MITLIHDLKPADFESLRPILPADTHVICPANGAIKKCIGCFGCWVKTPGKCVFKDGYSENGGLFAKSSKLVLISRMTYGGYSPFVKNVMDRSIGYLLPFFSIRNNEMHHANRYQQQFSFHAIGYGSATETEKKTFSRIVSANAVNLNASDCHMFFLEAMTQTVSIQEVFA